MCPLNHRTYTEYILSIALQATDFNNNTVVNVTNVTVPVTTDPSRRDLTDEASTKLRSLGAIYTQLLL